MFNKRQKIQYWTDVEALTEIEEARPTPYKEIKPSWWKEIPTGTDPYSLTAKNCPSFSNIFSNAYVLRMWCDSKIIRKENGSFEWSTSSNKFVWEGHPSSQFSDYLPNWIGSKVWATAKPVSPWYAKTPKGYSIYQMPVMYDASPDFVALEGVIHTDQYHFLNIPMLIFSSKNEFDIKLGTPLALHIPFKREKFLLDVREETKTDKFFKEKAKLIATLKFKNSYRYFLENS